MCKKIKEWISKIKIRFILVQIVDVFIAVMIFLALTGSIKYSICIAVIIAYAVVALIGWIRKAWHDIKQGRR